MTIIGLGLDGIPIFDEGFDVLGRMRVIPFFLVEGPRQDLNVDEYYNNRWTVTTYPLADQ